LTESNLNTSDGVHPRSSAFGQALSTDGLANARRSLNELDSALGNH
jgi:hypothetical protein